MKNKQLITTMLLALFVGVLMAQRDIKIDYKAFSKLPDVHRSDVKKLKAADVLYFEANQDRYKKTLPLYLEIYGQEMNYAPLDWRIAMCYLHSEDKPQAINYLLKCDTIGNKLYHFYLGKAYHFDGQFENAKTSYHYFAEHFSEEDQKLFFSTFDVKRKAYDFDTVMQQLVHACDVGLNSRNDSNTLAFENIKSINSENDELYPVLHSTGVLVFSSNKSTVTGVEKGHYQIYDALCDSMFNISFPQLSAMYPRTKEDNIIALPYSEFSDKLLYQSMQSEGGDVMMTYKKRKKVKGMPVPRINSDSKEGVACYVSDSALVFSSDRAQKGMNDLYITFKNQNDKWIKPVLVGGDINTPAYEEVVTFYDGKLYFITNAEGGIGGYDIYSVAYLGQNNWGPVENLGYPINTADNDMGYFPVDAYNAFYCGVRPGGIGGTDIYKVTYDTLGVMDTLDIDSVTFVDLDIVSPDNFSVDSLALLLSDTLMLLHDSIVSDTTMSTSWSLEAIDTAVTNVLMLIGDTLGVDSVVLDIEEDAIIIDPSHISPIDSSASRVIEDVQELIIKSEESDTSLISL